MRVQILKHATPKMKYRYMQFRMGWNAELKEQQEKEYQKREELRLAFGDALDALKLNDPNWQRWYDDDKNIPDFIRWNENDLAPIGMRCLT